MNISGPPIAKAMRATVENPNSMVVIHDSLDHRPGQVSHGFDGSPRGHNGVRSIIAALGGSKDFHRIRIGIGRGGGDVADYVLGRLSSHEKQQCGPDGEVTATVERLLASIAQRAAKP